jgi:hypothetical protein
MCLGANSVFIRFDFSMTALKSYGFLNGMGVVSFIGNGVGAVVGLGIGDGGVLGVGLVIGNNVGLGVAKVLE